MLFRSVLTPLLQGAAQTAATDMSCHSGAFSKKAEPVLCMAAIMVLTPTPQCAPQTTPTIKAAQQAHSLQSQRSTWVLEPNVHAHGLSFGAHARMTKQAAFLQKLQASKKIVSLYLAYINANYVCKVETRFMQTKEIRYGYASADVFMILMPAPQCVPRTIPTLQAAQQAHCLIYATFMLSN